MIEPIFFNPWIWIVPILLLILVIVSIAVLCSEMPEMAIVPGLLTLMLAGFYFGMMLPPYDASFYRTYQITGEVTDVQAAFAGDEGTISQSFVVEVEGISDLITSDDQRFRTIEEGDEVTLACSKEFRYFQAPWFDCAFGGNR